jgi:hypothetical protein
MAAKPTNVISCHAHTRSVGECSDVQIDQPDRLSAFILRNTLTNLHRAGMAQRRLKQQR